tara:strand:- start:39457 stop:40572 length:1116 start_codon:yes stop_codon:yes gene_type:complete
MLKRTPLFEQHLALGAKMVPFAGWEMPLQYGSLVEEHHMVRKMAGVFDVSHMRAVDIEGAQASAFLRYLLANNISKLKENGQALYGCMLNHQAKILDDLITYRIKDDYYRIVINAGTTENDLDWIKTNAVSFQVEITPRYDLAMLAIQGPEAFAKLKTLLPQTFYQSIEALRPFKTLMHDNWMVARTGYTGEDGVEILLPNEDATQFWNLLIEAGVAPIGLGARDTLRLEAGLNLYGQDMDDTVTPLTSNLAWTVDTKDVDRDFIGKAAYLQQKDQDAKEKLVGVVLADKGVLRPNMKVYQDQAGTQQIGMLTSGTFSPTLSVGIGFARIHSQEEDTCWVAMRGKTIQAKIIRPPFLKAGKANFDIDTIIK